LKKDRVNRDQSWSAELGEVDLEQNELVKCL